MTRECPITPGMKQTGKRSAGKPHAAFDVAGAGNVTMVAGLRSLAKAMELPPAPTVRAPALDPTCERLGVRLPGRLSRSMPQIWEAAGQCDPKRTACRGVAASCHYGCEETFTMSSKLVVLTREDGNSEALFRHNKDALVAITAGSDDIVPIEGTDPTLVSVTPRGFELSALDMTLGRPLNPSLGHDQTPGPGAPVKEDGSEASQITGTHAEP